MVLTKLKLPAVVILSDVYVFNCAERCNFST